MLLKQKAVEKYKNMTSWEVFNTLHSLLNKVNIWASHMQTSIRIDTASNFKYGFGTSHLYKNSTHPSLNLKTCSPENYSKGLFRIQDLEQVQGKKYESKTRLSKCIYRIYQNVLYKKVRMFWGKSEENLYCVF